MNSIKRIHEFIFVFRFAKIITGFEMNLSESNSNRTDRMTTIAQGCYLLLSDERGVSLPRLVRLAIVIIK